MPLIIATSGWRHCANAGERAMHDCAVSTRLLDVGALVLELGDVVARRECLVARAAHDDAAALLVADRSGDHLAQALPHRFGKRVELLRAVQHDG
jgi:hypothetical protein